MKELGLAFSVAFAMSFGVGTAALGAIPDADRPFVRGLSLTATEAGLLEGHLAKEGGDAGLEMREELLGYYAVRVDPASWRSLGSHVKWLVQNQPEKDIARWSCRFLYRGEDQTTYDSIMDEWTKQSSRPGASVKACINAAMVLSLRDGDEPRSFLERAATHFPPEPPFWNEAGAAAADALAYTLSAGCDDSVELRRSRNLGGMSRTVTGGWQLDRERLFVFAAVGLEAGRIGEARSLAEAMINVGTKTADGHAVHRGHALLGLALYESGDEVGAGEELLRSAAPPASRWIAGHGASMLLARQLICAGRKKPVLEYLERCSRIWQDGRGSIRTWREQITGGAMVDFAGHLGL